jgi:hypothetical protein
MNPESTNLNPADGTEKNNQAENPDRREMFEKFGKFAAYAAPFTVLALTQKADAATGTTPGRHIR